jgi:Fe-S-cluster containining protein
MELVAQADDLFRTVERVHGELMPCRLGCNDCCSVYFELSLIEAFTMSAMFRQTLSQETQTRVLTRAEMVEPLFVDAKTELQCVGTGDSRDRGHRVDAASRLKIPCPLNEDGSCVLYEHRPITCRLYGIPQNLGDRVVSCPRTGFRKGRKYHTVNVCDIQSKLFEYSSDLLSDLLGLAPPVPLGPLVFVPVALRTHFGKEYFLTLGQALEKI